MLRRPLTLPRLLLVAAVLLAGCGGSSTPPGPRHAPKLLPSRGNLQSIIEDDNDLYTNVPGTLAVFKSLGADRIRLFIDWQQVAPDAGARRMPRGFDPSDPGAYPLAGSNVVRGMAIYDIIDRAAKADGIKIDLDLGPRTPEWATGPGAPAGSALGLWKPSATQFGAFVHAMAERYSGHYTPQGSTSPLPRIDFWSLWNEPNYGQYLAPQAIPIDHHKVEVAPKLYRHLIDAAWQALQATGHGGDTILFGETAPAGQNFGHHPGNFDGMVPLRFIRALYCVGSNERPLQGVAASRRGCPATAAGAKSFPAKNPILFHATGFSAHLYPQGINFVPDVRAPNEPDYADIASLPELEQTLDAGQAAYGSYPKLPIYSTEFGYQTDPPVPGRPDPTTAADDLNWSEYLSYKDPRVRSFDQYLLEDPLPTQSHFATGLEFDNGMPKATYAAYRMPLFLPVTDAAAGQKLEVWGDVRPAHFAKGRQEVEIQFAPSGGSFKTISRVVLTNPDGYYDLALPFTRSGQLRAGWKDPQGPELFSRTVTVSVR